MKIGILTFHSQLNYGGVLQCWALQMALEKMGHDVVVIDRRLYEEPTMFGGTVPRLMISGWVKLAFRVLMASGGVAWIRRCTATKRFINSYLKLTKYHFHVWKDAPKDLDVDVVVVGSDQIWHCGDWGDPRPYLLENTPVLHAIAYAASFGMSELPAATSKLYQRGLLRFKAISCRESEGVKICRELGFDAEHVVDPTLLALFDGKVRKKNVRGKKLVCYLLGEDLDKTFGPLCDFASKCNCHVDVFVESPLVAFPLKKPFVKSHFRRLRWLFDKRVRLRLGAGPEEFMRSIGGADWVVSDSFHALMFSIINNCNARIVRPNGEKRAKMFSRIQEFANHTTGPLISSSLAEALRSFANGEEVFYDVAWIKSRKAHSEQWLADALNTAAVCKQ